MSNSDELRRDEYALIVISMKVEQAIRKVETVRRDSRNTGHHCAYRQAADSLCDRLKIDLPLLRHAGGFYNSHQLKTIDDLTQRGADLLAAFKTYVEHSEFHMKGMLGDPEWPLVDAREAITNYESK